MQTLTLLVHTVSSSRKINFESVFGSQKEDDSLDDSRAGEVLVCFYLMDRLHSDLIKSVLV